MLGSTVVRCAIHHAHSQLHGEGSACLPLERCSAILDAATDLLRPDRWAVSRWTLRPLVPCGSDVVPATVLPGECRQRTTSSRLPFASWFVRTTAGDAPAGADRVDLVRVRTGVGLLREIVPQLADSVLSHAHLVVVFPSKERWRGIGSSSQFRLTGTIFLSRELLDDPWTVAEQILHESLHQKLYDFRFGTRCSGRVTQGLHRLWCARHGTLSMPSAPTWDTFRVFAAFHVYVHLAFLGQAAVARTEDRSLEGVPDRTVLEQKIKAAAHRARYLSEQLTSEHCWNELGAAGRRLHCWLTAILDALDEHPPPAGAVLHLLMDLYRKEAIQVRSLGSQIDPSALHELLTDELDQARALLGALARRTHCRVPRLTRPTRLSDVFYRLRRSVAVQLRNSSPDGYRLGGGRVDSEPLTKLAGQLIESSSVRLSELLPSTNESSAMTGPGNRGERVCDPRSRGAPSTPLRS